MSKELCKKYLDALNKSNIDKVLSLFAENAMVISPLYGEVPAVSFFKDLFSDTEKSHTTLLNIFDSSYSGDSIALHFSYAWTLKNGKAVQFEVVDIFELSDGRSRFKKLTIIYDTNRIRKVHSKSKRLKNES